MKIVEPKVIKYGYIINKYMLLKNILKYNFYKCLSKLINYYEKNK